MPTPEEMAGIGVAVMLAGGLIWKKAPIVLSWLGRTNVSGSSNERRNEGHLTTEEHDKSCALKMKCLAYEITGPINERLAKIEEHEEAASRWVQDLDRKVDQLLSRGMA